MEMNNMIKKIAWDTFKNTGDINVFLEYKEIDNLERRIQEIQDMQKNTNIDDKNIYNQRQQMQIHNIK